MSTIFKRSYWATDNGKRVKRKTKVYYIKYTDADGKRLRIKGFRSMEKTRTLAAQLEGKAADGPDPFARHRNTPLSKHLQDFKDYMQVQSLGSDYISNTISTIQRMLDGCEIQLFSDIDPTKVEKWLEDRRGPRFGLRSFNSYVKAFKCFLNWMMEKRGAQSNPMKCVKERNQQEDIRRDRRSISQDEFNLLIETTQKQKPYRGTSGTDRAMLYIVAAGTGFRKEELASLTDANFKLDGPKPTVTVKGAYTKNGKPATLPLQRSLAIALKEWMPNGKLWPGTWCERAAKMLHNDLDAARTAWIEGAVDPVERKRREKSDSLAQKDKQGMVFDFHALRGQFITNLVLAGVHPKIAQKLARHSTITLTMDRYAKVKMDDLEGAIEALPTVPNLEPKNWPQNWPHDVDIRGQSTPLAAITATAVDDAENASNLNDDNDFVIVRDAMSSDSKSAPCQNRTDNLLIKSQLLCQLS
jgi:site-specific recombinase XerD